MILARRQQMLRRQSAIKLASFLGILLCLLLVVVYVENMLLSCVLAFVISCLLGPSVNAMERSGVSRTLAVVFVFFLVSTVLGWSITWLIPLLGDQVATARAEFPKYISGISNLIAESEEKLNNLTGGSWKVDLSQTIAAQLSTRTSSFFEQLPALVSKLVTTMLLAPFIAFFMIKDGRRITRDVLTIVPNSVFEPIISLFHHINEQLGQFVRARLLESAIVGIVTLIGLIIIGFPFSPLLALFAALTNLIPYVGPVIGAIPAILIALVNGETSLGLFLVILVYFIAQLIDTVFIIPLVVAKIVDLHPVTVVVAIILGSQVMGVLGMLISIPVASVLKVTIGTVYRLMTDSRE